jgi:hypothetical protein
MTLAWPLAADDAKEQILVRLINETKAQINQATRVCQQTRQQLTAENAECAQKLLQQHCTEEEARLRARLALLRRWRGDRRRPLTKAWHSIKRTGREIWHRLGPTGRTFFRSLEKDIVQTVVSGGSLAGGGLRRLVLNRLRTTLRREGERGLEHMLSGRASAQARSSDNCNEVLTAQANAATTSTSGQAPAGSGVDLGDWSFAGDDCSQEPWLEELWPEVEAQLVQEHKACQRGPINNYLACLQRAENEGQCPPQAIETCEEVYAEIHKDISSGSGLAGQSDYTWDISTMTFSFSPGSASGSIYVEDEGGLDECRYIIDVQLQGTFDYPTCQFSGTGIYNFSAIEGQFECIRMGERGEIANLPITWQAELANGQIRGQVIRDSGNRFYFTVPLE